MSAATNPSPAPATTVAAVPSKNRAWSRFRSRKISMIGAGILLAVVLIAVFGPLFLKHDPIEINPGNRLKGPSAEHWLGTDQIGRDVASRMVHGGRISMMVGLVAVSIYVTIGTVLGAISGYFGGWIDNVIQRVAEAVMALPALIVIISVVAIVGPSLYVIFFAIGLLNWPAVCRIVRAEFLSLRERDFVMAAYAVGASQFKIVFRHILPNCMGPVIVAATLGVAMAILTESGLSFLGLGVQPPTPSWGGMLSEAGRLSTLESEPWLWIPPGLAISLCVLAINFVGDGLRDALDPRINK